MDWREKQKVDSLITSCGYCPNIERVVELLPQVDVNARHEKGWTALHTAMIVGNADIVKLLLGRRDILLDSRVNGETALHAACKNNNVECVRLFLAHQGCTNEIVGLEDKDGNTAEVLAVQKENLVCAELIQEFTNDVTKLSVMPDWINADNDRLQKLTYDQLVAAIDKIENNEAVFRQRTDTKKREREEEIRELESKINAAREEQERENNQIASNLIDIQNARKALLAELHKRPDTSHQVKQGGASVPPSAPPQYAPSKFTPQSTSPPSAPPPSGSSHSSSSVIPVCPGCSKEMWPPVEIYNCSKGHLICSVCKPKVYMNQCTTQCGAEYTGRSFAMEKMIRQILGVM